MREHAERGLAVLCDSAGMIRHVLLNDLHLPEAVPGRLFLLLVDPGSRTKALDFLMRIKTHQATVDWELNVLLEDGPATLHFSGGVVGEQILIVAAGNGELAARIYDEMMRISNEQVNLLRAAIKQSADDRTAYADLESHLYDEISRLNNELVDLQRELAKRTAELERLNREKNYFLGMAAHDLRNPLHTILSYSAFLLEHEADSLTPTQREFLEVIYNRCEWMARLVDDLLDVARIEAGRLDLDLEATDIHALVTRNVALHRAMAAEKGVEIDLEAEPLPLAVVDPAKIEQILNNLISNAVKFSPPGGRVEVRLSAAGEEFQISVRDYGPGIAPEDMPKLFQPFQRGKTGTAGEKSTGLGLAIVKRIVDGHGGRIWAESTPGQGATFYVRIPFEVR